MKLSEKEVRIMLSYKRLLLTAALCTFLVSAAEASENERYKAIPASPGGPILIIDTKEGHLWTWNNSGVEETDTAGVNPRIRYQGNVRKNMISPKKPASVSPQNATNQNASGRF